MLARSLGFVAAAAVATNAILLPPEMSTAVTNSDSELAAMGVVDPENQVLTVSSGKCVHNEGDCSIILHISTAKSKAILINGITMFTTEGEQASPSPVNVLELSSSFSLKEYLAAPEAPYSKKLTVTQSAFEARKPEFKADSGEEILQMQYQIYALDGQPVDIPLVVLKILKSVHGELMVLSANLVEVVRSGNPTDKLCADYPKVCQFRDYIINKAHAAKAGVKKLCGGRPSGMPPRPHPHHGGPPVRLHHPHHHDGPPPHGPPHGRPFGHHMHGGPHGHHHHHGITATGIAMMIIGGLTMIMATWVLGYIVGTVVGYTLVGLWLLYRRLRGSPRYQRVALDETDVVVDEKMVVLPDEEPPAYEEKEVVV